MMALIKDIVNNIKINSGYFKDVQDLGDNIMVTCPFHSGGNESHPSMGITTENNKEKESGLVHCFTCGWSGNIETLVMELSGGFESLLGNPTEDKKCREIKLEREIQKKEKKPYIDPIYLTQFKPYSVYLMNRGITERTAKAFYLAIDEERGQILFPVRDRKGRIEYVCYRDLDKHSFHIPKGKSKGLYGLYESEKYRTGNSLVVTEGAFDCMTVFQAGLPCVALLGLGSNFQINIIKNLHYKHIVLALDGDKSGKEATKKLAEEISEHKFVSILQLPEGKDPNDVGSENILGCEFKEYEI